MPGATNTKLHSSTIGSRAPAGPAPRHCKMVASPVTSRQPATSSVISEADSPIPAPIKSGTGITLNTATMICWMLSSAVSFAGGHS